MKKTLFLSVVIYLLSIWHLSAQSTNIDFESTTPGVYNTGNAIVGWGISNQSVVPACPATVTSWVSGSPEFSIMATPILSMPGITGVIPNSPLGGSNVAVLNSTVINNYTNTRLVQTFTVTPTTNFLNYAVAGAWQDGGTSHDCCQAPKFKINVYDCSGNLLTCLSNSFSANPSCPSPFTYSYNLNASPYPFFWSSWQTKSVDLSPYTGSCVTLEVISSDCSAGGHYGYILFDAKLTASALACGNCVPANPQNVYFCAGSSMAHIMPPQGAVSYSWTAPANYPPLSATQATQSILAIPNATAGHVFTVNVTPLVGCPYTTLYAVAYTSFAISSVNSQASCAQATNGSATVNVLGGTNCSIVWTNSLGATVGSSSVVTALAPGAYNVSVTAPGCGSSAATLTVGNFGSYNLLSNPMICEGASSGQVVFTYSPTAAASKTVAMGSTGTTPPVSNTFTTSTSNFTFSSLSPGGTYTTSLFDGTCTYTSGFSINVFTTTNIYSLSAASPTLCQGQTTNLNVSFTNGTSSSQYSCTVLPNIGMVPNSTLSSQALLTPTSAPGTTMTSIYTVQVIPNSIYCPSSKTIAINVYNPTAPTVNSIAPICSGLASYTIQGNPGGGVFTGIASNGVISPQALGAGTQTFVYTTTSLNCLASTSGSFTILPGPSLSVTGNTQICAGNSTTLTVTGANNYSWDNGATGPVLVVSPNSTSTYSVTGTSTAMPCPGQSIVMVSVSPNPVLSLSGNTLICPGDSATITAIGANTYSWNTGSTSSVIVVTPNTTTNYSVIGTNTPANCSSTQTLTVATKNCITGLETINLEEEIKLYPNPTNGKFFVETPYEITVVLLDGLGRVVFKEVFEKGVHTIDLVSFPNGIYFLSTKSETSRAYTKVLKSN